ncbi:SLBB domain-containing protein, partial [candidate division KSB1 bacterium]
LRDEGYFDEEETTGAGDIKMLEGIEPLTVDSLEILEKQLNQIQERLLQQKILLGEEVEIEVEKEELKPFGYDIFNWIPTSFEPPAFGRITPDYMVGPGDEIRIEVWGQTSISKSFLVDREGAIFIDKVGKISCTGLTYRELRNSISNKLKKFYSQISVDVSLGKLRSVQVFVAGQVKAPGGYWLTALSSVYSAPYFAGGASENGSLRNIELHRNNTVTSVDFYELLLKGRLHSNIHLQEGDVVIVPPVGKRVKINGEVKVPAIYEVKPDENLEDLMEIAGGFKSSAYLKRIQIWRIVPPQERKIGGNHRTIVDINFFDEKHKRSTLFDGDSIVVNPIMNLIDDFVELTGSVKLPGIYSYADNKSLRMLFKNCEGLLDEAYLENGLILRSEHDTATAIISFSPKEVLYAGSGIEGYDIALHKKDFIRIYSKWEIVERDSLEIFGAVKNPGKYELFKNMTLNDLIFQAGGLKESAYKLRAEVSRVRLGESKQLGAIDTSFVQLNEDDKVKKFKLNRFDNVFIREDPDWMLQRNIMVLGEVVMPGKYSITSKNERLSDIIERAGGLTETAYPSGITFHRNLNDIGVIDIDLPKAMNNRNDRNNIILADADSIYIPEVINTVRVEGAVNLPRSVLQQKGKGVGYYIQSAGGLTERADKGRISIVLANGRIVKSHKFWSDPEITGGSVIFVPTKVQKEGINWGSALADAAQIVSSLITSIFILDQVINK